MKLTESQIDDLYPFTRNHFVEWYDLQTELVDHLANDIENVWKENPSISFEKAKDIAFKKFGIFGFSNLLLFVSIKVVSPKLKAKLSKEHPEYNLIK